MNIKFIYIKNDILPKQHSKKYVATAVSYETFKSKKE